VENEYGQGQESVYSTKVRAGKRRTYFFDVRKTKGDDFYITLTESTKKFNDNGYTRHKIFLYKEDFNRFMEGLQGAIDYVKDDLLPEYDYEQFDRRQEEWEEESKNNASTDTPLNETTKESDPTEEDISW
jgi:hypothetical protein